VNFKSDVCCDGLNVNQEYSAKNVINIWIFGIRILIIVIEEYTICRSQQASGGLTDKYPISYSSSPSSGKSTGTSKIWGKCHDRSFNYLEVWGIL